MAGSITRRVLTPLLLPRSRRVALTPTAAPMRAAVRRSYCLLWSVRATACRLSPRPDARFRASWSGFSGMVVAILWYPHGKISCLIGAGAVLVVHQRGRPGTDAAGDRGGRDK